MPKRCQLIGKNIFRNLSKCKFKLINKAKNPYSKLVWVCLITRLDSITKMPKSQTMGYLNQPWAYSLSVLYKNGLISRGFLRLFEFFVFFVLNNFLAMPAILF